MHPRPGAILRDFRQCELDGLCSRVDHDKCGRLAPLHRRQHVTQKVPVRKTPILFGHLGRLGREPQDLVRAVGPSAIEPPVTLKLREASAQLRKLANERAHVLAVAVESRPVHPADLVILAIGVVVAGLAVTDLVAGEQQRHALGQQETR